MSRSFVVVLDGRQPACVLRLVAPHFPSPPFCFFSTAVTIVDKHYDDLIFSLSASGIDLNSNHWDTDIIHRNAYKSAAILISIAVRHLKFRDVFLQAVIAGLQREDMINETMNLICETFAHIDALPPLGIIQHTLDPDLLKIYSMDLVNWLKKYLQGSQDAICLRPDCMIEYLQ